VAGVSKTAATARDDYDMVQLRLRFPESLRVRIEQAAAKHGCSLNREIVNRLIASVDPYLMVRGGGEQA